MDASLPSDHHPPVDSILTSFDVAIWSLSPDLSQTLYLSPAVERLYGCSAEYFLANPCLWFYCVEADDQPAVTQAIARLMETGQCHVNYRIQRSDGDIRWLQHRIKLVCNETGQRLRVDGLTTDITEQALQQQQQQQQQQTVETVLSEREAWFHSIFDNISVGIALVNQAGYVVTANKADCEFLGYSYDELIGMHYSEFTHPDDIDLDTTLFQSLLAGERSSYTIDKRYLRRDQTLVWGRLTVSLIRRTIPSSHYIVIVCENITERQTIEVALQRQMERESLIAGITNRIRRSLNLSTIIYTLVAEVRHFLDVDRVLLYQFKPDGSGVIVAESIKPGCFSLVGRVITDSCFTTEKCILPYRQGRIQNIPDINIAELPDCYRAMLKQLGIRANLVLPVLQSEQVWGLMIAHQCTAPRVWQSEEINLLRELSDQLAIALQQAELYQQVQYLNVNLEFQVQERTRLLQKSLEFEALLKRITDRVRDSLDEQQILQAVVRELTLGLDALCCDAGIYSADQTLSTIACEYTRWSFPPALGKVFHIVEAPHAEIYPFLLAGQPCQFCNIVPHPLRMFKQSFTIVACPIFAYVDSPSATETCFQQEVLGDLWLFKPLDQSFNDQEMRLIQQVATQCAIAMRQARLYQTAQAQVQELEKLNHLKDDFLSTVSHELRSPMANIKMALQMLEVVLGTADPVPRELFLNQHAYHKVVQYFQILNQECHREIQLINDLLDLTRLDAGTAPLSLMPVSLQIWLPHISEPFLDRIREQQQHLQLTLPDNLPPLVTDLPSLERILTELLHNACKYTPQHETIQITVRLLEQLEPIVPGSCCEISVCNTGVEIPATECDRIFDKFYRIPNSDPWKHGGTGLGLALVKKLVEYLGGTIQVRSANRETCFILRLPMRSHPPGGF